MIDAHLHLWTIGANGCTWPGADLPAIHRDVSLADWRATPGAGEIDRVMLVQSQADEADTRWLLDIAAVDPVVAGVVGWTDLLATDAPARIAAMAADPRLRGLRPMVQDRADDWYDDERLEPALAAMAAHGLVLDALVRARHLPSLHRLALRHPALTIVIDHAAKPDPADIAGWAEAIAGIATCGNVRCKLSGLLNEVPDALARVVQFLWTAFGPDRLIWGSDWPVLTLAGDYDGWLAQTRAAIPAGHHAAVFGGNAARVYRLETP